MKSVLTPFWYTGITGVSKRLLPIAVFEPEELIITCDITQAAYPQKIKSPTERILYHPETDSHWMQIMVPMQSTAPHGVQEIVRPRPVMIADDNRAVSRMHYTAMESGLLGTEALRKIHCPYLLLSGYKALSVSVVTPDLTSPYFPSRQHLPLTQLPEILNAGSVNGKPLVPFSTSVTLHAPEYLDVEQDYKRKQAESPRLSAE